MTKKICLGVLCFSCFYCSFSQEDTWYIKAAFLKESFFYPSIVNFGAPVHPGFSLGIEKVVRKDSPKWAKQFAVDLGFYHHAYFQNDVFLLAQYGWNYQLFDMLQISAGGVAGYLHIFRPTEVYELRNGEYVKTKNFGRPNAVLGVNLCIAYSIFESRKYIITLDYSPMINGPFNISYGAPVVPLTLVQVGAKIRLNP